MLLEDPHCCVLSNVVTWLMQVIIWLSCGGFIVSSLPNLRSPGSQFSELPTFQLLERVSIGVFSLDYFLRMSTVPWNPLGHIPWDYFTAPMNVIDLLAILPFYLTLIAQTDVGNFSWLRVLRVVRLLRLFKASKYNSGLHLMHNTLVNSSTALSLLGFFLMLGVVIFGSLLYLAEVGEFDEESQQWLRPDVTGYDREVSPFTSIPQAFWCIMVTFTTVGYGDLYPTTVGGKCVIVCTMLVGLLVLALPIGIIGSAFTREYNKHMIEEKHKRELAEKAELGESHTVHQSTPTEQLSHILQQIKVLCNKADEIIEELDEAEMEEVNNSVTVTPSQVAC